MAAYKVPSDYATIQEAVDAASFSVEQLNTIDIGVAFQEYPSIVIGGAFNEDRKLTIRPDHAIGGLKRVAIVNRSILPIIKFDSDINGRPGCVTLQDLDIVRNASNAEDLVQVYYSDNITIERCRIGSISKSKSTVAGKSNLHIIDTGELVVRNSIFFSYHLGILENGIFIDFYANPDAYPLSVLLYNNIVSDYKLYGIKAITGANDESLLLLRNNVVVNRIHADDSRVFWSNVVGSTIVETSHNTAFVGAENFVGENVEEMIGVQGISGESNDDFLLRNRNRVAGAFIQHTWTLDHPNVDFFRLIRGGSLHHEPSDQGITVRNRSPYREDVAVIDDIEKNPRPAGIPLHTDRGADQIRDDDSFLNLDDVKLSQSVLPGGKEIVGHIILNGLAPKGGWKMKIASTNPAALPPATVTVAPGTNSSSFKIKTKPVATIQKGKIIVSHPGVSKSRPITIRPIHIAALELSNNTTVGGKEVIGTVTLELKAAPTGIKVTLESSSDKVVIPKSVTIPKGQLSASFPVKVKSVKVPASVVISATANAIGKKVTLKIKSK